MIGKNILSIAMAVGTLCSSAAFALPDTRQGNPLPALGIATPAGVGDIVRDHEFPNTLHVGPANTKTINGTYSELDSSGTMCTDFVNIRKQAYRIPATEALINAAYDNGDYVSNFFQIVYAIPRENKAGLRAIAAARESVRNAGEVNKDKIANYLALRAEWTDLTAQIASLNNALDVLNNQNIVNIGSCFINPATAPTCLANNAAWYQVEKAKIDAALATPLARRAEIANAYYIAKGEYEAVNEELGLFLNDIAFHNLIIQSQMTVSADAWDIEKDVIAAEEGKIVGRTSAGYNIFDNEAILLAEALQGHNFVVKQLDLFNVRINTGVTLDNPSISADNEGVLFRRNTWSFPANTLLSNSVVSDWQMPFERESVGDAIHFDTMDSNSFASGAFDSYVTKGARCGEYSQEVEEEYEVTDDDGFKTKWIVKQRYYQPHGDRVVFSQAIGLNYNYYAFPGPIRGECSIDVDRMNSYWRNQGRSKSWRWFRTTTNSWDNIRQTAIDNMGMECKLESKPESNNPEEALEMTAQFEQHMYSDMWQMFLAIYAEEYTVEVSDPEVTDPGKSSVGAALGTGLMKLCGANFYCTFSGIILKTLDSIGGSKAQGTTSNVTQQYGRIWKRYDKETFTVKEGSATIQMNVCIDASQC